MNKFLANLCCCFILKRKNRQHFRKKYIVKNQCQRRKAFLCFKDFSMRFKLFFLTNRSNLNKVFENKTVAVVGNADSIFDYNYGDDIDKHDIVIRMNKGFIVKPTSQGTKTTIIATSCDQLSEEEIEKEFKPKYVVWVTPKLRVMPKFSKEFLKNLYLYKMHYWLLLYWFKITHSCRPTTGLMIVDWITSYTKASKVDLYGFDFFQTNTFYNKVDLCELKKYTPHNFNGEEEFILNLKKLNKINIFGFNKTNSDELCDSLNNNYKWSENDNKKMNNISGKQSLSKNVWKEDKAYSNAMAQRVKAMVDLIDFNYNSIMDLGCGLQTLKQYISKQIKYFPINQYNQIDGTIIKDFNKGEFLDENVDVCFCSGIFEYIYNLEDFIYKISYHCKYLVGSYCFKENRAREYKLTVNNYSKNELFKIIEKYGFRLIKSAEHKESKSGIFIFKKY